MQKSWLCLWLWLSPCVEVLARPVTLPDLERLERQHRELAPGSFADLRRWERGHPLRGAEARAATRFCLLRAEVLRSRGEVELALQNLRLAASLAADDWWRLEVELRWSEALQSLSMFSEAREHLDEVERRLGPLSQPDPRHLQRYAVLQSRWLLGQGRTHQASLALRGGLTGQSPSPQVLLTLAEVETAYGRSGEARRWVQAALEEWLRRRDFREISRLYTRLRAETLDFGPRLVPAARDVPEWARNLAWSSSARPGVPPLLHLQALCLWRAPAHRVARVQHPLAVPLALSLQAGEAAREGRLEEAAQSLRSLLAQKDLTDEPLLRPWLQRSAWERRLAMLEWDQGNVPEALRLLQAAVEHGPDFYDRALSRNLELKLRLQALDYPRSRELLLTLMREARRHPVPIERLWAHVETTNVLILSGRDLELRHEANPLRLTPDHPAWQLMQEPEAREFYHDLLAEARLLSQENPRYTLGRLLQGALGSVLGRPAEALEAYRAIVTTAGLEREDPHTLAEAHKLLSAELAGQGRSLEALQHIREAQRVARRGGVQQNLIYLLVTEGRLLLALGRTGEALQLLRAVRQDPAYLQGGKLDVQLLEAEVLLAAGEKSQAQALLRELCADLRARREENELLLALRTLAPLCPLPESLVHWQEALHLAMQLEQTSTSAAVASDYSQALRSAGRTEEALSVALEALQRSMELREQLPALARSSRGQRTGLQALLEQAVALLIELGRTGEAMRWIETAARLELELPHAPNVAPQLAAELEARRVALGLLPQDAPEAQRQRARSEFLAALNALRRESADIDRLAPASAAELAAVQAALPPDTAVLVLYATRELLVVQRVTREDMRVWPVRLPRTDLQKLIADWRAALQDPRVPPPQSLRERLTGLLLPEGTGGKSRLWVVPSGVFWYLPLDTLVEADVGVLTPEDLRTLREAPPGRSGPVVVFSDPTGDLPWSASEGLAVAAAQSARVWQGSQATVKAFKAQAGEAGVLHLACHAEANSADLNASYLRLADGQLSLRDIYALVLRPGVLVVLSACRSGLGQSEPGREVASLSAAFRAAGAASVISSLWSVDDEATGLLFTEFYRQLGQGVSRHQALAAAKRALRSQARWSHPYYWSGFTLTGDPR